MSSKAFDTLQETGPRFGIKPPSLLLAQDPSEREAMLASSPLTYAALQVRQKRYELALRVIADCEGRLEEPAKSAALHLLAQIRIERNEFVAAKEMLVRRIEAEPSDLIALGLLQSAIHHELLQRESGEPPTSSIDVSEAPATPSSSPANALADLAGAQSQDAIAGAGPEEEAIRNRFGTIIDDPNTAAFFSWRGNGAEPFVTGNDAKTAALGLDLPALLPQALQEASLNLEVGTIHRISLGFENLTLTTFHNTHESCALITGNLGQSLLTIVRAEKLFKKGQGTEAPSSGTVIR